MSEMIAVFMVFFAVDLSSNVAVGGDDGNRDGRPRPLVTRM